MLTVDKFEMPTISPLSGSDAVIGGPLPIAALSSAEERVERARRSIGLIVGPAIFLIVWLLPLPELSVEAHRLAAIISLTVVWWVTEAIPLPATALVATALTVACGVATPQQAFAQFGNPIIFVFVGAFIIGRAVSAHGLDARFAASVLATPVVRNDLGRSRTALGLLTLSISGWMNNTATAAMMTPLARGVLGPHGGSFATGLLLVVGYAATIGGMITPIAAAPNLITLGLLENMSGIRLNFITWMVLCVPVALVMMAVLLGVARWLFPYDTRANVAAPQEGVRVPARWTAGQRNCLIVFLIAVIFWITPGLLSLIAPNLGITRWAETRLDEGVVAVLAACLLFVLPLNWRERRFTLTWKEAGEIDWGTILMFGGGLALGRLMLDTGLATWIGQGLVGVSGAETLWAVTAMAAAISILMTELISNTACISMLVPVVIGICQAGQLNPVAPALAVCLGGSLSFVLPISTPPNAIVYGTGLIPLRSMVKVGIILDVVGFAVIVIALRVLCPLLGFV
jgi:sodium-dependent dicarboxylate transporter 2/3/5